MGICVNSRCKGRGLWRKSSHERAGRILTSQLRAHASRPALDTLSRAFSVSSVAFSATSVAFSSLSLFCLASKLCKNKQQKSEGPKSQSAGLFLVSGVEDFVGAAMKVVSLPFHSSGHAIPLDVLSVCFLTTGMVVVLPRNICAPTFIYALACPRLLVCVGTINETTRRDH